MESSGIVFKVDATDGANQRLDVVIEVSGPFTSPSLKLSFPRWFLVRIFFENRYNTCHI